METTAEVRDGRVWIEGLVEGRVFGSSHSPQDNNNKITTVTEDVTLSFVRYRLMWCEKPGKKRLVREVCAVSEETVDIPAGAEVVVYRHYMRAGLGDIIAAIFTPSEQLTITANGRVARRNR